MEQFFGYTLGKMTNRNAGTCLWCFGTKNGKEYFIKQFLNPKYPYQDKVLSPERIAKKIKQCKDSVDRKVRVYDAVNRYSDGNDVRIYEFFRFEQKYYLSMEKIEELEWSIQDVYQLPEKERRRLCALIAHAVAGLHRGGLAHSDLKHENILFTKSDNGTLTIKVIDFDSAFFEADEIKSEDISGDWVYFSPEVWGRFDGIDCHLTCRIDIFALGVLFHQYFSGDVPGFDRETGCTAAGQAVQQGLPLTISDRIPADLRELLIKMLDVDPEKRPTAMDVFRAFQPEELRDLKDEEGDAPVPEPVKDDRPPRYCTNCGKQYRGEGFLCAECAAREADKPKTADPKNFFQQGGDFFSRPSGF